jgi:hydrogenase maturation protease
MNHRTLIIGYGNTLRTDDGVGRCVAERLAADARLVGATVIGVHQLAPELVVDISQADLVVFVDAGRGPAAGTFTIEPLERSEGARRTWSHHFNPALLLTLADELYGVSPPAYIVAVGVESFEVGDRLSPTVEAALPLLVDSIAALMLGQAASSTTMGASHA